MAELGALVRYALAPTLAALCWCTFLFHLRRAVLAGDAEQHVCRWWKDLDWAASRILASLGTVTGMLLAFRSNSALDRWATGRRKWSDVQATSRSLLRLLASSLLGQLDQSNDLASFAQTQSRYSQVDAALAVIPFFTVCLMHQMRGQGIHLSNAARIGLLRRDLLDHVPAQLVALAQSDRASNEGREKASKLSELEREKQMLNDDSPHQLRSRISASTTMDGSIAPTNLALATLVYLQRSLDGFHHSSETASSVPTLAGPVYAHCIGLVNSLNSHMTELEQVRDTPVPLSVSRHFSRLLLIHSAMLPFILVQRLGDRLSLCLVITAVVTGMLYGVDSFAAILGQPFGTDKEDLPLERFVAEAQREWVEVRASVSLFAAAVASKPSDADGKATQGGKNISYLSTVDDRSVDTASQSDATHEPSGVSHTFPDDGMPQHQQLEPDEQDEALADEDTLRDTFTF